MIVGVLKVPVNKRQFFLVTGGPFMECPSNMKGVKMAKEIHKACDVDIPAEDFFVPDAAVLSTGLEKALDLLLAGEPLYVGCMAGKGRTGLFLSVLAKAFDVPSPVEYVRAHYYAHAVETKVQYAYIQDFVISPSVRWKVRQLRRWSWLRFWQVNLTRMPVMAVPVAPAERTRAKYYS